MKSLEAYQKGRRFAQVKPTRKDLSAAKPTRSYRRVPDCPRTSPEYPAPSRHSVPAAPKKLAVLRERQGCYVESDRDLSEQQNATAPQPDTLQKTNYKILNDYYHQYQEIRLNSS
jgi:hypothetical protein